MTDRPKNVRVATANDQDEIFRLMKAAWDEQPIAPFYEPSVKATIKRALIREPGQKDIGVVGVIDGPTGLEGYMCAFITPWWFSNPEIPEGWRLEELTNFVHPDHRRSNHAKDLIQFAKWLSENIGLILIMGIMASERLAPKIRLYERQIKPMGGLFYHNAQSGCLSENV